VSYLQLLVIALLFEAVGLFAMWNCSRAGRTRAWLVSAVILLGTATLIGYVLRSHAHTTIAAFFGVYLLAALLWEWREDGLGPSRWQIGEWCVALAAAAILVIAVCGIAVPEPIVATHEADPSIL
jgi:small multidrug resistance family-3 protein